MDEEQTNPVHEHPEFVALRPKGAERGTKHRRYSPWRDAVSIAVVLVSAFVLAFTLIAFVFQSYQVDGPSMESTLQNEDRLIVWKVPRTWAMITGNAYIPQRGDIVIFSEANLAQYGQTDIKQLVKRVVGVPGDRVVVSSGAITIYNKANPKGFNPDTSLAYGQHHTFPYTAGDIDVTLKGNQVFVCGDNRTNSLDSRTFGPVAVKDIVGRLVLRIYPFDTFHAF